MQSLEKMKKEFNEEWDKSADWGGGKFGDVDEIGEEGNEYAVFIPNQDGIFDWFASKLTQQRDEWVKQIEEADDGYACIECGSDGYDAGLQKAKEILMK